MSNDRILVTHWATRWLFRALAFSLAAPLAAQGPLFREASHDFGLAMEHLPGNDTYTMSGGVGWVDVDQDGDDDLILAGGGDLQQVLRNDKYRKLVYVIPRKTTKAEETVRLFKAFNLNDEYNICPCFTCCI